MNKLSKNILCISGNKNSMESNNILNQTIFHGLKKLGYNIDLARIDYVENKNRNKPNELFSKELIVKGKLSFLKKLKGTRFEMLYLLWENIVGDFFFRPYDKKELKGKISQKYDLIITFCPPPVSALFASDVIKLNDLQNIKYIQYWSDPLSIGMVNNIQKIPIKRFFHMLIERRILKRPDEIIYCSPILCEAQKTIFPKFGKKMRWTDVGFLENQARSLSQKRKTNKSKITIGYFGAYPSKIRNILPLFEAISGIPNIEFIVRGDTDLDVYSFAPINSDIKVGRIPLEEIHVLENKCDILICLGNISGVQIPGKVFYYTSYDKPLIYITDGAFGEKIASYLKGFGRYLICKNEKKYIKRSIKEAIAELPDFKSTPVERLQPIKVAEKIIG